MENFSMGAGMASIAFWGFIAAVVIGGIWYDIRRKAEQQRTIRSIVESGKDLDPKVIESLLKTESSDPVQTSKDLKTSAIVTFFVGVGLAAFGFIIGIQEPQAIIPLAGIGGLLFCISAGLWIAGVYKLKNS